MRHICEGWRSCPTAVCPSLQVAQTKERSLQAALAAAREGKDEARKQRDHLSVELQVTWFHSFQAMKSCHVKALAKSFECAYNACIASVKWVEPCIAVCTVFLYAKSSIHSLRHVSLLQPCEA